MSWHHVCLLCLISFWGGMLLSALLSVSKCEDCKIKESKGKILKCKNCGTDNLHITNRFNYKDNIEDYVVVCHSCGAEYEIHNNMKKYIERFKSNEN